MWELSWKSLVFFLKKTYFLANDSSVSKPGQRFQNPRTPPKTFSFTTSCACGRRCWQLQLKSAQWFYSFIFTVSQHHQENQHDPSHTMRAWADPLSRHSSSLSNCLTHSLLGTEKTTVQLKSHVTVKYFGWRRSERMMNNNKKKNRNLGKKMQTAATIHDASYE